MSSFRYIIILIATFLMSLCAVAASDSNMVEIRSMPRKPTVVYYPATDVVNTVEVGETLIYKEYSTKLPYIELKSAIEIALPPGGKGQTLLPGEYLQSHENSQYIFYMGDADGLVLVGGKSVFLDHRWQGGIYVSKSDPKMTGGWILSGAKLDNAFLRNWEGIAFEVKIKDMRDESSFKRELIYNGVSQNVLSILYREYKNDWARPAFSQEIKYDLNEDKIIGYRGSRFEITKASNQGLTYKILRQLN